VLQNKGRDKDLFTMILIFYHCMVGTSTISYLLVTVISFEIFFFIGSINPIQALNKEETNLQDYNNLKQLVDDIKNGVLNEDKIPFNDFKNSGAYQNADKNMQDCINLAAKIGHNLGDNEIVHCSENVNYFKDKYPNVSVPQPEGTQPGPKSESQPGGKPTLAQDYNNSKKLVDDIENGVLNEDKIPFSDFKNSGAYQNADKNMQDCINLAAKIGHNLRDDEIVHCSENVNYFKDKYPGISRLETNASMNVPETNASMNVPETNASMNVPES